MILSLDLETSGLTDNHEILSIGCCTENWKTFYQEVRWNQLLVSTHALEVNQIDLRGNKNKKPIGTVLYELGKWLTHVFPHRKKEDIILLGFNVGTFDLRFMKKAYQRDEVERPFPFHYRHIELNSCLQLLNLDKQKYAEFMWESMEAKARTQGDTPELSAIRKALSLGEKHNALADAVHSMCCWKDLQLLTESIKAEGYFEKST